MFWYDVATGSADLTATGAATKGAGAATMGDEYAIGARAGASSSPAFATAIKMLKVTWSKYR